MTEIAVPLVPDDDLLHDADVVPLGRQAEVGGDVGCVRHHDGATPQQPPRQGGRGPVGGVQVGQELRFKNFKMKN